MHLTNTFKPSSLVYDIVEVCYGFIPASILGLISGYYLGTYIFG